VPKAGQALPEGAARGIMARTFRERTMSERADALRQKLIRNFDERRSSASCARRSTTPNARGSAPAPPPTPSA
jgi:hypothetical protein